MDAAKEETSVTCAAVSLCIVVIAGNGVLVSSLDGHALPIAMSDLRRTFYDAREKILQTRRP